jgi:peptidoglycan hydrolase CwlO-like protein
VAVVIACLVAFSTIAVPALADVSRNDIQAAEAAAREAEAALRDAEAELAAAVRRLERLGESLASVDADLADREADIVVGRAEARDRIARMYMSAGGPEAVGLLGVGKITDLPAHIAYLAALADQDREFVNGLAVARADLVRFRAVVETSIEDQERVIAGLEEDVEARRGALEGARAEVSSMEAEWERQEAARRAAAEAERRRQAEAERQRQEEEERRRQEEEERQQAAQAALAAAAAAASAAGWTAGSGVEPWRPLVEKHFPAGLVDEALSVMYCESKGDPLVINPYSAASGLFQHLPYYWPSRSKSAGWEGADIFDPEANIAVAAWLVDRTVRVEKREPWGHWTCKP